MSQQPLTILISGAGIAGASLALMLARQPGFQMQPKITLIERTPQPRTTGQAVDIRGPGVDVIRKLRLEPEIKAMHTTETGLAFLNSKGAVAAVIPSTGDAKRQSASSEYEILRGDLAGLILDNIEEEKSKGAKIEVVYGECIEHLDDREDGTGVDVKFANGKLADQRFDVVVGADGIASKTRTMIFGKEDLQKHVSPSGLYIGFFTIPRVSADDTLWRWCQIAPGLSIHLRPHCNPETMGAYLTICNPTASRNAELEDVIHADVAWQKAYLRQRFKDVEWQGHRFVDGLEECDDFYMTHWCQVRTPQWAKGRCVTLGDAAFATMGIGTSLALTGAYCIAGELSKIRSSDEAPNALHQYENIFRPFVKKHQRMAPGGMQVANPQTEWGVWLFHTFVKVVAFLQLPWLFLRLFDGVDRSGWSLPEYGW